MITIDNDGHADVSAWNRELGDLAAEQIIAWSLDQWQGRVALLASMQKTSGVLMHMLAAQAPATDVLFVDTGLHFPQTLELRDEFARRFRLNFITLHPELTVADQKEKYGRHLFLHDENDGPGYPECCRLRKEAPFVKAAHGRYKAILSGLTRADGDARASIGIVSRDPRIDGFRVNPLARWTHEQIDDYTDKHSIPTHPLYELGYSSIGCSTCTTPVCPLEPNRAGRWRHIHQSTVRAMYCGINLEDRAGI